MIKYFFKLEWKNLVRNKYISFLKISGLVTGLLVFMVAGYYVLHELSYDHFQDHAQDKYALSARHNLGDDYISFNLPYPLTYSLQSRYPEVVRNVAFETKENTVYFEYAHQFIKTDKSSIAFVEENFFDFFKYKFIAGDAQSSFSHPNLIIISEEEANKYFGGLSAVNKSVSIRVDDIMYDCVITGIIQNPPDNSNFNFHWIGSLSHFMSVEGDKEFATNWDFKCKNYVQLTSGTDPGVFMSRLADEYEKQTKQGDSVELSAVPITSMHVDISLAKKLKIFATLGILILIISVINYVLLSTVEQTKQMQYFGIERISGARNRDFLIKNSVSILIFTTVSFALTIVLFFISKPYLSVFFESSFASNPNVPAIVISLLTAIISVVILASIINHLIQGSQKPIDVLKNKYARSKTGKVIFNSLLTFQMIAFIALISCSVLIHKQLKFMQTNNLGFNKGSLITLRIAPDDVKHYPVFKNELLKHPSVINVGGTSAAPLSNRSSIYGTVFTDSLGNKHFKVVEYINVDRDFFTTLQFEFKEGSGFYESPTGYCVVNQTFVDEKELEYPLEETVELGGREYKICAVLEDFHQQSMRSKINPMVAYLNPEEILYAVIRFSGNPQETISLLEKATNDYLPNTIPEYEFMDEKVKASYQSEARFNNIVSTLTLFSVLIAVFGLLGLSYLASLVKIKEIGIRKVNGAKVRDILLLLNREFVKWVAIAFIISTPLTWYVMEKWLENFAYKTDISWWIFLIAGVLAFGVASLTVSWQSWRAANKNPVEALKYE